MHQQFEHRHGHGGVPVVVLKLDTNLVYERSNECSCTVIQNSVRVAQSVVQFAAMIFQTFGREVP